MGAVLAQALLTDVESDSGNAFVEQFLQHEDLADSQCHQTLSTIAHTAPQQPALAAAAHRAVAAQPRRLLPLAATAVAAQLPADQAQQWLTGVKSAVTERARQPAPDPATYRWAADYLDQIPQRPATDPGDQHKFVVLVDAVLAAAWVPAAVEPAASAAETTTDTAEDRRRFMGGRRFGESAAIATAADATRRYLANMRASRSIRLLVTFLAACHLALVVRTTVAAMSSDTLRQEGWSRWFYLFFAVAINLLVPVTYWARRTTTIACISSFVVGVAACAPFLLVISLAGHGSPPPAAPLFIFAFNLLVPILYDNGRTAVRRVITWIWLSFVVVAADTSFALLANPAAHGPLPPWAPWSVVFGAGLCALTLAWFIRAGRVPPA